MNQKRDSTQIGSDASHPGMRKDTRFTSGMVEVINQEDEEEQKIMNSGGSSRVSIQ